MSIARTSIIAAAVVAAGCSNTTIGRTQVTIASDPQAVNFGSQVAGSRTTKTVTLRNDGLAILVISSVAVANDARSAFSVGPTPTSLSPATTAAIQVTYAAPDATGADGANLTVTSNADNAPQLSISLSAQSVASCTAESDVAFCTRVGKNCGAVTAPDNCGASRTVTSCGSCSGLQICNGNGVANVCGTPSYPVTVTLAGAGSGSVSSSPAGITCGSTCSAGFTAGASVTLSASPTAGSTFTGFTGDCSSVPCTLSVDAAKHVTATFSPAAPAQHLLSVSVAGSGAVNSSPAGINGCTASAGTCAAPFNDGAAIVLTATAAQNFAFSGWTGAAAGCGSSSPCSVTLSGADAATTATFTPVQHTLTVTVAGNGAVNSSPAGINACAASAGTCSAPFNDGASIVLTAAAAQAFAFSGWTGAAASCGSTSPCTVTLASADAAATATFTPIQHTLTVTVSGSGTVNSSPAGINGCTASAGNCAAAFNDGASIVLTAAAAQAFAFSGWTGAAASCGSTSPCTVTLSGSNASTTATFTAAQTYAIGGSVTGLSGSGLVLANSLNGGPVEQLSISLNGSFVFPTRAAAGQTYLVSVMTQPSAPAQNCTVAAGSGSATADVANISVSCPTFVLATSPSGPNLITANAANVYFTTNAEIYVLPVTGGAPAAFAPIAMANGISGCYGFALDSTYLYFTEYAAGRLNKVTLASPYTLTNMNSFAYSAYYAHGALVAGGNVYWGGYSHGQVEETPTGGSSITELFNPGFTYDTPNFAADSTNLYWSSSPNTGYNAANQGAIYQLPLTATSNTGTVTLASGLATPNSIATNSGYVYWTDNTNNNVKAVPIGGNTVATVAPTETGASSIVADGSTIYWVDVLNTSSPGSSAIRKCTIGAGGNCGPIMTVASVGDYVSSLAINSQSLFWVGAYSFKIWQSKK